MEIYGVFFLENVRLLHWSPAWNILSMCAKSCLFKLISEMNSSPTCSAHSTRWKELKPNKQYHSTDVARAFSTSRSHVGIRHKAKGWRDAVSCVQSDNATPALWPVTNSHTTDASEYQLRLRAEAPEVAGKPSQTFPKLVKYQRLMVLQLALVKHQVLCSGPVHHKDGWLDGRTLNER